MVFFQLARDKYRNSLYEGNVVEYNQNNGISHEISYNAIFRGNYLRYNGYVAVGLLLACVLITVKIYWGSLALAVSITGSKFSELPTLQQHCNCRK